MLILWDFESWKSRNEFLKIIIIESLIEIEEKYYLFNEIISYPNERNCEILYPFIICDKLSDIIIPKEVILKLIDLYPSKSISQALLHVNIKSLDDIEIKEKIEKYNLTSPLICLCINKKNPDYFYPIIKMYEYFCCNYKFRHYSHRNLEDKEYAGYKILWYIEYILSEQKYPEEKNRMEKNIFAGLILKIACWLLSEEIFKEFLKLDLKYFFMTIKKIFLEKKNYDLLINFNKAKEIKDPDFIDLHPLKLIEHISNICFKINKKEINLALYDFIFDFSIENNIINLKIETICSILENSENIDSLKKLNSIEKNKKIIDFLDNLENITNNEYNLIINSFHKNDLDIKLNFLAKNKDFKNYIKFYKHGNMSKDLFEFSKDCSWDLKKEIIENLSERRDYIQLDYIELLINSIVKKNEKNEYEINFIPSENDTKIINYILCKYISLLTKKRRDNEIYDILKYYTFLPINQCLYYCEEFYQYCFNYYDNFEEICCLTCKKLDFILNDFIDKYDSNNLEKLNSLIKYIDLIFINFELKENTFFRFLEQISKYEVQINNLIYQKGKFEFEDISIKFHELIKDILKLLIIYNIINFSKFNISIKNSFENAKKLNLMNFFEKALNNDENLSKIFSSLKGLFVSFSLGNEKTCQIFKYRKIKKVITIKQCDYCNKIFNKDEVVIFLCEHTFHKLCVINITKYLYECPLCMNYIICEFMISESYSKELIQGVEIKYNNERIKIHLGKKERLKNLKKWQNY